MPTKKPSAPIKAFHSQEAWTSWLAKHHKRPEGLWLKIFKKGSGIPTLTHEEALEISLCYGWIDGQRKSFDSEAFIQKFTPRRKDSIWSQINREKALRLIREKRMQTPGLKAIEAAKLNGRWKTAYSSQKTAEVPADLAAALEKHPKAADFFKTLKGQNRYAILFRIQTARKIEIRQKKIQAFVEMLRAGKTIYPLLPKKTR